MDKETYPAEIQSLYFAFNSGVFVLNEKEKFIAWNNWLEVRSGLSADQVIGKSFSDIFPNLAEQRIHHALQATLKFGLPATISNILNQSPFPLFLPQTNGKQLIEQQIYITPLTLDQYSISDKCCIINITDVTAARMRENALERQVREKKKAEKSLTRKHQQLQTALVAANAGTFQYYFSTQELCWDDRSYALFNIDQKNCQNLCKSWKSLHYPEDANKVQNEIQKILQNENTDLIDFEYRIINSENNIQWIGTKAIICRNTAGDRTDIIGVQQDITAQKKNQRLLREKEAAELANKTKSEFLANISHELRTPLHGILGFTRLGLKKHETADQKKIGDYFFRISQAGERLLGLLDDLLDLSKLEAGKMTMDFSEHDLSDITTQCIEEQLARANESSIGIKLTKQIPKTIVTCDNVRIRQVITNLLSNAIKFSSENTTITINLTEGLLNPSDKVHKAIKVSVANQGIGIPAAELDTVFNKFIQSSKTNTGAGGTGLGLTICKEIIDSHNGKIWAESRKGYGAVFHFVIPTQ